MSRSVGSLFTRQRARRHSACLVSPPMAPMDFIPGVTAIRRRFRHRTRRPLLALACAGALTLLAACGGSGPAPSGGLPTEAPNAADVVEDQFYRPEVLRFASVSGADEEATAARLRSLVERLGEELDMPTEFIETTDYSSVIEAMRAGRVDIAGFGPFSYVIASAEANAMPLVAAPNQGTGQLGYHSLIITQADSDIAAIEDLRGRSMAFGDPASTSGYLFPRLILSQYGINDLDAFFSETSFSGGHDASLVAVTNGQVDAAGVCDTCIERYFREGLASPESIKVIERSDVIPPSPTSVRADLDPELRQQITDFYLNLVQEDPQLVQKVRGLAELPTHPYVAMQDSNYNIIRELADRLQVDLSEIE